jgi:hypothetical protein
MIQIRNVPDELHRALKSRAALAGMSLSDYLLNEIRQLADRPTLDQLRARLDSRPPMTLPLAPSTTVWQAPPVIVPRWNWQWHREHPRRSSHKRGRSYQRTHQRSFASSRSNL